MMVLLKSDSIHTREVWNHNLDNEFDLIKKIVDDFPYIAIVIKSPGVVLLPLGNFKTISDSHYQTLKANVDMLKPIQLGLTFFDKAVNLPTCGTDKYCIWQFNFREFSFTQDIYATDSIELMRQSKINFEMNNKMGVDANSFAEVLMSSGIVLNEDVCFVTFHGGYDFGYLLKLLTGKNLPDTKTEFFNLIKIFFPEFYDTKYLMKFCGGFHGGLDKLAELLGVERIGICHQAGSDSLLTSVIFKKIEETFFHGLTEKYGGVLYGFGAEN